MEQTYSRRSFMKTAGLGAAAFSLNLLSTNCASGGEKPNILFIMSDDHTSQAVSAYGGILIDICPTPNIDRLANEGMIFTNCFVTNSICTPSRSSIFAGTYAHKNGVYKFTALDQSQPTLPKYMQQAGYETAFVGKYHLHSNPEGIDYFSVLPGQGRYHDPEFIMTGDEHPSGWIAQGKRTVIKGHSSDAIADQTLDYLQKRWNKKKPFMLFCHFKAPHDTWEYAERYKDFLADVDIPEPPNLFDDYEGRSDMLKNQLQYIGSEWGDHTNFEEETKHLKGKAKKKKQYQLYMQKYLRCVKGVDDNVGRILDYLDQAGLAENTVIMYTGDQGFFLGEHGLYDKRIMYEEALRMPFLVRWPDKVKAGSTSDGMILNVDFAPTIMAAAGLGAGKEMQGSSFMPLLEGTIPEDWRTSMYYRYYYSHFETEPHWGIRTYRHKLIYFNRIDQWECYDLEKDPHEMNNVYDHPEYQAIVQRLKQEMARLQTELGDDPDDVGDHPYIGKLEPAPLYTSDNVKMGLGDQTLLFRFRTAVGGTLFSHCDLDSEMWGEGWSWEGFRSLFFREGMLVYMEGEEEYEIESPLLDNQWHTVAIVLNGKYPEIYIDGNMKLKLHRRIGADQLNQKFHIGAGIDDSGYMGYNFIGDIEQVFAYDQPLSQEAVKLFAAGHTPEGHLILDWKNGK